MVYYIDHQKDVVTRRTRFDLDKALDRAHILEGTLLALDHIDEVINIIRSSKPSRLQKKHDEPFRLYGASGTIYHRHALGPSDRNRTGEGSGGISGETKEIAYYQSILGDELLLMGVIKDELLAIKKAYADERRTRIIPYEGEIDIDDLIHEQEIAVTLTHFGYVKRTPADTYKAQRRGGKGIMGLSTREEDFVEHLLITSSHNMLLFITTFGRVYSLKGYEIPDAGRTAKGIAIVNLLQLSAGEKIATMIPISGFEDGKYLLMATKEGIIKKTELKEYSNIRKGGLIALELREGDELINARLANENRDVMLVTRKGMSIRFSEADVRATGRASIGVRGITLRDDDYVIGMDICDPANSLLIITEKGFGKRTDIEEYRIQSRGGKGLLTYKISEKTGELAE